MKKLISRIIIWGLISIVQVMSARVVKVYNSDLPVQIESNTTYVVKENLGEIPAAKTSGVKLGISPALFEAIPGVSNVILDFDLHELTLQNDQIGILADGITNLTIKNGTIRTPTSTLNQDSSAIKLLGFTNVTVENMILKNTFRGIFGALNAMQTPNTDLVVKKTTFSHPSGIGILLEAIQGMRVEESTFLPNGLSGFGILLLNNYRDVALYQNNFIRVGQAVVGQSITELPGLPFLYRSENLDINKCQFVGEGLSSISIIGGVNTHIGDCTFTLGPIFGNSILAQGDFNVPLSSAHVQPCSGIFVDRCTFNGDVTNFSTFITLGNMSTPDGAVRDVFIQNSTFTQTNPDASHWDILAPHIQGALIENCIFDSTSLCVREEFFNIPVKCANIHLGFPAFGQPPLAGIRGARDVTIRKCLCTGKNQVGVLSTSANLLEPNVRISIVDSTITAQEIGIEFTNTTSSDITRCIAHRIHGSECTTCGIGILLEGAVPYNPSASSSNNALVENTVSNNGCGILIKKESTCNVLRGNSIFKNLFSQIDGDTDRNKLKDNVVFGKKGCCPCDQPPARRDKTRDDRWLTMFKPYVR